MTDVNYIIVRVGYNQKEIIVVVMYNKSDSDNRLVLVTCHCQKETLKGR